MPIRSKKQWKYLASEHPEIFSRWQHEKRREYAKLPPRLKKKGKKK